MSRQLQNLRPWAQWAVRHRLTWVLLLMNVTLHVPVMIGYAIVAAIPQAVRDVRDGNRDLLQASREARAERSSRGCAS